MQDVRKILKDFTDGVGGLSNSNGQVIKAFMDLQGATYGDSAISNKCKELISVAIGVYNRCQYCIVFHVFKAYEAGATREEILDAAMVAAGGFGAGPSIAYSATTLLDAVNEFENDFK
ncbi:MAG: carboxymuconolactone decarboxylase family protein [Synergistaceae bacterium]|nr:carboxymuconolactone decarboxylase family protein [Synergistaceae bacterium]